jgi:hypothetical protein
MFSIASRARDFWSATLWLLLPKLDQETGERQSEKKKKQQDKDWFQNRAS